MTRPTDAVRSAVRAALRAAPPDPPGDGAPLALVACSGGADSLALAAGASQAARSARWRAGAVIVDHQLQQGSAEVCGATAATCRGLGLDPVVVLAVDVARAGGPEAAARRARYDAFARAASATGAAAVMVAHSLDDQAETVLLGLARGSGARSLAGMPAQAPLPGAAAWLLRPLLGLTREQLEAACREFGLRPWQDPHNSDPRFTRARVRHRLLPALAEALGPGVPQALARTAILLRDDDEALTAAAEAVLGSMLAESPGSGSFRCRDLAAHPAAIRRRVLLRLAVMAGAPAASITAQHLFALDDLATGRAASTAAVALPGCVNARVDCGRLVLARRQE